MNLERLVLSRIDDVLHDRIRVGTHVTRPINTSDLNSFHQMLSDVGVHAYQISMWGPECLHASHFNLGDLYAESGQTSQGSFSAVSKPNFASKY